MFELVLSTGSVIALDQMTKRAITAKLSPGQIVLAGRYFRLHRVANCALAGVLFNRWALLCLWLGAAACLVLLVWQCHLFESVSARVAVGGALGGSSSNLYDHFREGATIDFLDIAGWPVFNIADAAIVVGAISSLWLIR